MEDCMIQTIAFDQDDTTYLLDKIIWEQYDMVETRLKVLDFLKKYKKARAVYIGAIIAEDRGLTSNVDLAKTGSSHRNTRGFAENSDIKMDADSFINATSPLIAKLKQSFTNDEKEYFEYCLASGNSESNFCLKMNYTKFTLQKVKNSCLLKIAFATHNAVRKNDH